MLRVQAAKAFEIIDVPFNAQNYNDRIVVEKLPSDLGVASVLQIAMAIMDAAKTKFHIKDDNIWVHGLHPDHKDGWRVEIRTDDTIPHYQFQAVVAEIITDKLMAIDAEQIAAQEKQQQQQAEAPPALRM